MISGAGFSLPHSAARTTGIIHPRTRCFAGQVCLIARWVAISHRMLRCKPDYFCMPEYLARTQYSKISKIRFCNHIRIDLEMCWIPVEIFESFHIVNLILALNTANLVQIMYIVCAIRYCEQDKSEDYALLLVLELLI